MTTDHNKRRWHLFVVLAIILTLLTLSPVILRMGDFRPMLFGVPYTLWTSILTTAALVALTGMGSKYLLNSENTDEL